MSLLLNYFSGLDLERRDQRGLTALMKAAIRDRSECVATLLMAGAWGLDWVRGLQSLPQASPLHLSQSLFIVERGEMDMRISLGWLPGEGAYLRLLTINKVQLLMALSLKGPERKVWKSNSDQL